jgi:type IV pilus assembly protein PilQ
MKVCAKKYWVLKFLTLVTIVCIICPAAIAGDANDVNDANKPPGLSSPTYGKDLLPEEQEPSRSEERVTFEQRMQKKISVEFRNTPIEDVIRIMAEQADVDIIKSPAVTGAVTVTLRNVPLEEALNNILAAHGYSYVVSENMIRVITAAEKIEKPEALQTRTYEIVYADVKEVVKALDKFRSDKGRVSSIEGTSYVIVTDTESKIRDITAFIEKVDRMTPQILIEARIYDITSKESFDIGTEWYIGRNTPITEITRTKTSGQTGAQTNDSTTTDSTTTSTTETTSSVTSGDDTTETAKDSWRMGPDGKTPLPYRKSNPFIGGQFNKEAEGGTLSFGVLNDAVDIDLALNILHKQVGAKLLANPRVLVLDNEKATIDIISEIPYMQLTSTQLGGTTASTSFKEVGVKLEVTPHVAIRDEMVRLHLKPVFSVRGEDMTIPGYTGSYPVVDRREAETKLLVKNGQTVVLGGLRKKETTQNIRKVPLLGDLPLFGELFRSSSEETDNSELVVFITVWIIKQPVTMSQSEQDAYHVTVFRGPKPSLTEAEKAKE